MCPRALLPWHIHPCAGKDWHSCGALWPAPGVPPHRIGVGCRGPSPRQPVLCQTHSDGHISWPVLQKHRQQRGGDRCHKSLSSWRLPCRYTAWLSQTGPIAAEVRSSVVTIGR